MNLRGCLLAGLVFAGMPLVAQEQSVLAPTGKTPAKKAAVGNLFPSQALNNLVVKQWIHAAGDGSIRGVAVTPTVNGVTTLAGAEVMVVTVDGRSSVTNTGDNGEFTLFRVEPGTYGIFVRSARETAVYGLHVLPPASEPVSETLEVSAGSISPDALMALAQGYLPNGAPSEPYVITDQTTDPLGSARIQSERHQVSLDADGVLRGSVSIPFEYSPSVDYSSMNVMIVQNGAVVVRGEVNSMGQFAISGLKPGVYTLVAAGEEGIASVGFELIAAGGSKESVKRESNSTVQFVSAVTMAGGSGLNVELCPAMAYGAGTSMVSPPLAMGAPGFMSSSGGGGGGGGMGGDGLLGLAALAGGLAALAGGDNNNFVPPPASPAVP